MRKSMAVLIALALALACAAALAETVTYDFGDFTIDLPAEAYGQTFERTETGGALFMLGSRPQADGSFACVFTGTWLPDAIDLSDEAIIRELYNGFVEGMASSLAGSGLSMANLELRDISPVALGAREAVRIVIACDLVLPGAEDSAPLQSVESANWIVSEPGLGTYSFGISHPKDGSAPEFDAALDSIAWVK